MKNSVYLSLGYLLRNKKMFVCFIIMGLIMSIIIIFSSFNSSAQNNIKEAAFENPLFNRLIAVPNVNPTNENEIKEMKESIEKLDNVKSAFRNYEYYNYLNISSFKTKDLEGGISLYVANNKTLPEIVSGHNFPDENGNYLICPQNFYPTNVDFRRKEINSSMKIDLENKLGKTFEYKYKSIKNNKEYKLNFELVGLYKNSKYSIDEDVCYTTEKVMNDLYFNTNDNIEKIDLSFDEYKSFYVYVDKYENVERVTENLKKMNFTVSSAAHIDTDFFKEIITNTTLFVVLIYIVTIIFLIVILIYQFNYDEKYYRLLFYLGYRKKQLYIMYFLNTIFKILISFISVFIFSIIMKFSLLHYLKIKPFIFYKWKVIINYTPLVLLFFIIVLISVLSTIICIKEIDKMEGDIL